MASVNLRIHWNPSFCLFIQGDQRLSPNRTVHQNKTIYSLQKTDHSACFLLLNLRSQLLNEPTYGKMAERLILNAWTSETRREGRLNRLNCQRRRARRLKLLNCRRRRACQRRGRLNRQRRRAYLSGTVRRRTRMSGTTANNGERQRTTANVRNDRGTCREPCYQAKKRYIKPVPSRHVRQAVTHQQKKKK